MRNMEENNTTIDYYNHNADQYFNSTVNADMIECCNKFLKYVSPGGRIIDIGAGSGRDSRYFKAKGFDVDAIDASAELCKLATKYAGVAVQNIKIEDWNPKCKYDGIWANASLLHLSDEKIEMFINRIPEYMNPGSVFYFSMKMNTSAWTDSSGRYFVDFSENKLKQLILKQESLKIQDYWISGDTLNREKTKWLNSILIKIK